MPKSDAAGGIRSGRHFARSSNIVGSLEPRGHREELLGEVLLDVRLAQSMPVSREITDVIYDHRKTIAAPIVGIKQNTVETRMFCARRRVAELLRAQGIAGAAT
jgi:RNA polymerase sigma-70 factor (ECF subfamily)